MVNIRSCDLSRDLNKPIRTHSNVFFGFENQLIKKPLVLRGRCAYHGVCFWFPSTHRKSKVYFRILQPLSTTPFYGQLHISQQQSHKRPNRNTCQKLVGELKERKFYFIDFGRKVLLPKVIGFCYVIIILPEYKYGVNVP